MAQNWYAINNHPNKEDLLWNQLLVRGCTIYCPRFKSHLANPSSRKVRPFFSRCYFVHGDLENMGLSALQWMPYAKDLYIYNKGDLAVVPDYLIAALYQRVGDLVDSFEETRNFDPDAPVTITSGQFLGMKQFLIPNYLEVNGSVF